MASNMRSGTVLVTNVDADIGFAVASRLIECGYTKIMLAAKSAAGARTAHEALSQQTAGRDVQLEMHEYSSDTYKDVELLVSRTVDLLGGLDMAINCLSMLPITARPTAETEAKEYKAGLTASSREMWLLCKAQSAHFISQRKETVGDGAGSHAPGHSILNIIPFGNIGVTSSRPIHAASSYSAIGITKSLARDVKPYGIRVNAVCPGVTDSREDREVLVSEIPDKDNKAGDRLVRAEEVANVAVFVAGQDASGITGVAVPVDFGWCLTHS